MCQNYDSIRSTSKVIYVLSTFRVHMFHHDVPGPVDQVQEEQHPRGLRLRRWIPLLPPRVGRAESATHGGLDLGSWHILG